jgi:3-hydroxyisobutyrate dehydrogenase-like beta-hydroxyacid dehydrogenase
VKGPSIGFIGFGEAAFHLAKGFRTEGIEETAAFDIHTSTPQLGDVIRERASESGTRLLSSLPDVLQQFDIVFSAVTAANAGDVAEGAATYLGPRHIYIDINSVSPALKQRIDRLVTRQGARFVEAAVMAAVPAHGHRVPMSLCGSGSQAFAELMRPYGMHLDLLDGPVGSASALKMFRSVVIKGLEALLLECLIAAEQYGAGERVLKGVGDSFPGIDWNQVANYLIGRTAIHGERRAHEMEEVARTLEDVGVDPIMASAAVSRLKWCAGLNLKSRFGSVQPKDYHEVVKAIFEVTGK